MENLWEKLQYENVELYNCLANMGIEEVFTLLLGN